MNTKPSTKSEGTVAKIVVAVVIALLVGSSSPWWWNKLFPTPPTPLIFPECSPEILRSQLLHAGYDKSVVIKSSARTMREKVRLQDFDCVSGLAAVLLDVDQDNGHGLYFSGEAWRVKAERDPKLQGRMRDTFFRYLDIEPSLNPSERDGVAAACYEREKGYCAERTAWINHLMSIDFYQQAQYAVDKKIKIHQLQRALGFVKNDLKFGGFDQIIPSPVLKRNVEEELQSLTHHSSGTR